MKEFQQTKIAQAIYDGLNGASLTDVLRGIEKKIIVIAMRDSKQFTTRAARKLGVGRSYLYCRRKRYALPMDLENYYPRKKNNAAPKRDGE